jgi:hypothetical protein
LEIVKLKKNKKIIIPIIFVLIFAGVIISGCVDPKGFPVWTISPDVDYWYENIQLIGQVGIPFCKAKNYTFVYDTISHENWSDYAIKKYVDIFPPYYNSFYGVLIFSQVQYGVTYYVRAVAYCYDFKKPFQNYAEGYYQGDEKTFIVN